MLALLPIAAWAAEIPDVPSRVPIEVAVGESPLEWRESPQGVVNDGLGTEPLWVRLLLENGGDAPERVWVDFGNATLDRVELSWEGRVAEAGLLVPRERWPAATVRPAFPIDVPARASVEVTAKIATANERTAVVLVVPDGHRASLEAARSLSHGVFYGALAVAALVAGLFFAALRDRVYAFYAVYTASLIWWMAALDGHLFVAAPALVAAPRVSIAFAAYLAHLAGLGMVREIVSSLPRERSVVTIAMVVYACVAGVAVSGVVPWHQANALALGFAAADLFLLFGVSLLASIKGVLAARWLVVAWAALAVFMGIPFLSLSFGGFGDALLSWSPGPHDGLRVGLMVDVLVFACALADRTLRVVAERDAASGRALAAARLGRFFPEAVVRRILASEDESTVRSERRLVTILFADLRGFTDLTDRTSPERITAVLNGWLTVVVPLVEAEGGVVDKIMGDGLMVVFGGHEDVPAAKHARGAAHAAVAMQRAFAGLAETWRREGLDHDVQLRVGLHQDHVTVGNFGSDRLVSRTAIGGGVNLAARLENGCVPGRILASYAVASQVPDLPWGPLEERSFKGIARPQKVAELDPAACDGVPTRAVG
jgi:class 3 adenylate cyclase